MFNLEKSEDQCLEYDETNRLNELEATEVIKMISVVTTSAESQSIAKEKCNNVIRKCEIEGLSISKIERLTGISFGVIRRC